MNEREILYFLLHRREYIRQQRIALEQDLDDIEQQCDHLHVQYEAEARMIEELIEHLMSRVTEIRTVVFHDVYEYIRQGGPYLFRAESVSSPRGPYSRRRMHLTQQYWLVDHPNLTDDNGPRSYKAHYRVNKQSFEMLVNLMSNHPEYLGSQLQGGIPIYVQVACVLWRFANCHYGYRIAYMNLGVTHGSYNNFTNRFINVMAGAEATNRFLRWPSTPTEIEDTSAGFKSMAGIKDCIGAIDGKLVVIQKPSINGDQWIDRKNHASMSLMAVCNHRKMFTSLRVGHSGRNHDARVFTASELYNDIVNFPERRFPNDTFILADTTYPLSRNVIVPYPRGSNDEQERYFNRAHSSTRILVENSFSLLVNRWRFLYKHLYLLDIERMAKTIFAACLLHNLCITMNDEQVPEDNAAETLVDELGRTEEEVTATLHRAMPPASHRNPENRRRSARRDAGIARRNQIKAEIYANRTL